MASNDTITVLVADDDQDYLFQMRVQLEGAGFNVVVAEGRVPAEELLGTTDIDIAVVDLMMEEADGGFALCHSIKAKSADIPVILVTGVTSETGLEFDTATSEERSWVKADALLDKPVRPEQLIGEISRLLGEQ